jgi:hypothetical protein
MTTKRNYSEIAANVAGNDVTATLEFFRALTKTLR